MEDPKHLLMFAKVVETGSVTGAAGVLGIPKGTVSRTIARLENNLSARLLERSTRSTRLTEAGKILYDHCLRIAEEIESAEAAIGMLQGTVRGKLRIAAPFIFGHFLLSPLLPDFLLGHPEVEMELELTNRQVDPVEENFDFVIRVGELQDSSLIVRRIGPVPYGIFASHDYLARHNRPKHPNDLHSHTLIGSMNTSERNVWTFVRGKQNMQVEISARLDVNDPVVRLYAAVAGIGIAHLPVWVIKLHEQGRSLQKLLVGWQPQITTYVHVLYPSRRSLMPKSHAFLSFLEQRIPLLLGPGTKA